MKDRLMAAGLAALSVMGCLPGTGAADAAVPNLGSADWEPRCTEYGATAEGRQLLWTQCATYEPTCLYTGASAWAPYDKLRPVELYTLATVRRRYDVGRCVSPPQDWTSSMMASIRYGVGDRLRMHGILVAPEEAVAAVESDATYGYQTDHLNRMCGGKVKPAAQWPAVRAEMLREADEGLRQFRAMTQLGS
jgi:hypothetical protein